MKLNISESEKNRIKGLYEQSMGGFISPTLQTNLHSSNPPIKQVEKQQHQQPKQPLKSEPSLKDKIQQSLSELNKLGYSKELASAIVGNMRFESEVNPKKLNKNDAGAPAFGLIQWRGTDVKYSNGKLIPVKSKTPSRLKKLLQLRGYNTIPVQISFLHKELTTDPYEMGKFEKVKVGSTPYEMGKLFDEHIERSAGESREERGKYAQNIYDDINNGHYNYA